MSTSLLLLFFILSATLFSTPQAAHRDQAVNYWKSFYPTIPMPSLLSQHISQLSDDEINTVISLIQKKTLSSNVPLFCKTAGLTCSTNDIPRNLLPSLSHVTMYKKYRAGDMLSTITVEESLGIFFRESTLKKGTQFNMGEIKRDLTPAKSFLPHSIASLITLEQIGYVFQNTSVRDMMRETVYTCEHCHDERTECPSSVEELVQFTSEVFPDTRLKILYPKSADGAHKSVLLDNIRPLLRENHNAKFVACHELFFPYTVLYCHVVFDAQLYQVDLVDQKSSEKINDGMVAVCHRNTSFFNPNHVVFSALKTRPGEGEICHWMSTGSITFVHLDDTLAG